jgi:uncharacterized protein YuzE
MYIEEDKENRLMYVGFGSQEEAAKRHIAKSNRIGDQLVLDYDSEGKIIGVEFLQTS